MKSDKIMLYHSFTVLKGEQTDTLKNGLHEKGGGSKTLSLQICNDKNPSCSKVWKQMHHRYDLSHDPSALMKMG